MNVPRVTGCSPPEQTAVLAFFAERDRQENVLRSVCPPAEQKRALELARRFRCWLPLARWLSTGLALGEAESWLKLSCSLDHARQMVVRRETGQWVP